MFPWDCVILQKGRVPLLQELAVFTKSPSWEFTFLKIVRFYAKRPELWVMHRAQLHFVVRAIVLKLQSHLQEQLLKEYPAVIDWLTEGFFASPLSCNIIE